MNKEQATDALTFLRCLGSPDELYASAATGSGVKAPLRNNAHIHVPPNFSAFDSVDQALTLAAEQQIRVLGVSNYYDYHVYRDFEVLARKRGIFPLFGLEIIAMQDDLRDTGVRVNDPGNPGKTYLCGKGITRFCDMPPEARRLVDFIRLSDNTRIASMIDRMQVTLRDRGLESSIDPSAVIDKVVVRHGCRRETVYLQERHISQAFQEEIFRQVAPKDRIGRLSEVLAVPVKLSDPGDYVGVQNELRSHLMKSGKPAFVEESFLSFAEARQLVLELGGIPSYPVLADGFAATCEFEANPEGLIEELKARGVYAVEWIPTRNSVNVVKSYVTRLRSAGFVATAGTEHNTLDLIPFDPACKDGPVPPEIREVFWEGACVVAAHQFLSAHGDCGYVDGGGNVNPAYGTNEERIRTLAQLGESIIRRYLDSCNTTLH